jgi:hypothetical protein
MPKLLIPEALRRFLNSPQEELDLPISQLNEFSTWLLSTQPSLYRVVFGSEISDSPEMNGFLNLYMGQQALTHRLSENLPVLESASLRLVTSISGG